MMEVPVREVWASAQEFTRGVHLAFPGRAKEAPGALSIEDEAGTAMEIALVPGKPIVIASMQTPVLHVTIRFTSGTPAQQARMLAYLDRAIHRGGG